MTLGNFDIVYIARYCPSSLFQSQIRGFLRYLEVKRKLGPFIVAFCFIYSIYLLPFSKSNHLLRRLGTEPDLTKFVNIYLL